MKDIKLILKSTVLCIAAAGMGASNFASAADTELHITGTVKASPCSVETNSGSNIDVSLGDIQAASLSAAGQSSDWKAFTLHLVDCPTSTSKVTATFTGTPADENTTLYKNTGDASSVQIELTNAAGDNLGNGKNMEAPVSSAANDANFPLKARAFTTAGNVTPGSIVGTVLVGFTYQ